MKNKKLMDALSLADESFVEEAAPTGKGRRQVRFSSLHRVACACLAFAIAIAVFVPLSLRDGNTPELPPSEDGGTAPDINVNDQPKPAESYEEIFAALSAMFENAGNDYVIIDGVFYPTGSLSGEDAPDGVAGEAGNKGDAGDKGDAGSTETGSSDHGSQQIVDNQTDGVEEPDIVTRTNTHVFYLYSKILTTYTLDGENSKQIAYVDVNELVEGNIQLKSSHGMFLSDDGNTLIIAMDMSLYGVNKTGFVFLDVSDPKNISFIKTITISGKYVDCRLIGDELLLLSKFDLKRIPNINTLSSFIPSVEYNGNTVYVPADKIYFPQDPHIASYTVAATVDINSKNVTDMASLLSFSDNLYVSSDSFYLTRQITEKTGTLPATVTKTEIASVSYKNGSLKFNGIAKVTGTILNRFSMDEYDGIFRVVTTSIKWGKFTNGTPVVSADLYCFDAKTLEKKAEVLGFAPDGETVQSVRYDGSFAYVCTALKSWIITDPVFFFNLSDINSITYTDTGDIPGFSSSLINFGDGILIGVGMEDGFMKIEAYEEKDGKVVSIDKYTGLYTSYSFNYRSYFIDRENGYIGIPVSELDRYDTNPDRYKLSNKYLLVKFDGKKFTLVKSVYYYNTAPRGFVVDEYLYVVNHLKISAQKIG